MKKIIVGNSIDIELNNCVVEIGKIEILETISSNFSINIIRDGETIKTDTFPLADQTLYKGDYLDYTGIYRSSSNTYENYTAEQQIVFENMTNVEISSKNGFKISASNSNIMLKIYYSLPHIVDEQIYVLNKNEELIAVFNKDDEEPIFNPRIKDTQNAESVLTFSISPNNSRWEQIKNPENLYVVGNQVFSTNFEGCFQEFIAESNEDYIAVTAYERQKLLARKYVKAWNSETGFEAIDDFMVVLLSGGDLYLKNNDTIITSNHLKGTSGYALDALLFGTGWTSGE